MSQLFENILLLIALLLLLRLLQVLSRLGVFDPIHVTRAEIPPLLIATTPQHTSPRSHPLMHTIASLAAARGVEEEPDLINDKDPVIRRGEFLGVYFAPPSALRKPARAAVGVVLDVGEMRVNDAAKVAWQERLDAAAAAAAPAGSSRKHVPVEARVLRLPDVLHSSARLDGGASAAVAHWRLMRKLARKHARLPEARGAAEGFVQAFSSRRGCVVAAIPVAGLRSVWG